jgi:hypothetical protein
VHSASVGAIVGGTVGGIVALAVVALVVFFRARRSRTSADRAQSTPSLASVEPHTSVLDDAASVVDVQASSSSSSYGKVAIYACM